MTRFDISIVVLAVATVALSGCSNNRALDAAPTPGASEATSTPIDTPSSAQPSPSSSSAASAKPSVRAKPTTREATQFAQTVADAAAHRNQRELPTPTAAGGHWRDLVSYLSSHDPYVHCRRADLNIYDCGVAFERYGKDHAYFYVSRFQGHWRVTHASNVID